MPAESAELTFSRVSELEAGHINVIEEVASRCGFNIHSDAVTCLVFQPFENTEENKKLVEECIEEIRTQFPDLEVSYSEISNKDPGKRVVRTHKITITDKSVSDDVTDDSTDHEDEASTDIEDIRANRGDVPQDKDTNENLTTGVKLTNDEEDADRNLNREQFHERLDQLGEEMDDIDHIVEKEVRLTYLTELDGDTLRVNDSPMTAREMGYGHHNEFEYGQFFYCNCGDRFWNKEAAKDHLVEVKEQSD